MKVDPADVYTQTKMPVPDVTDRIRAYWTITEQVAEELILFIEVAEGDLTGPQKKKWVVEKLMEYLRELEERKDYIPDALESVVFVALRFSLGFVVERVLNELGV